jgi:hypothetical protein
MWYHRGAESGVGRQVRLVLQLSRRRLELSEGCRPTAAVRLICMEPCGLVSPCLRFAQSFSHDPMGGEESA